MTQPQSNHTRPVPALSQQVIWITGASSGIGAALVEALYGRCAGMIITARNRALLTKLAQGRSNMLIAPADITDLKQMKQVADAIQQRFGRVDTLIANAGTCEYLDTRSFESCLIRRVFDTNVNGLAHTLEVALPLVRNSQRGYLVGMSSSATFLPFGRAEAYGASKAAVSYLMESLRVDLTSEQIDVSIINPGFVQTPLTDRNNFTMPMRISATEAADAIVRALTHRPWEIHFPRRFTWLLKLLGALPACLRHRLSCRLAQQGSDSATHSQE